MCLAVPVQVKEIYPDATALVELNGVERIVSLLMTPDAQVGEYVLIHTGYAISVIDAAEAAESLRLLAEIEALTPGPSPITMGEGSGEPSSASTVVAGEVGEQPPFPSPITTGEGRGEPSSASTVVAGEVGEQPPFPSPITMGEGSGEPSSASTVVAGEVGGQPPFPSPITMGEGRG